MLITEIGRFGDNLEDLKPSDFRDVLPKAHQRGLIGIFWHLGNDRYIIFSTSVLDDDLGCVEMGQYYDEETNPDDLQIDFNLFHKEVWNDVVTEEHPELADFSWDHFSRGRILYEVKDSHFTIFGPKGIVDNSGALKFIADNFNLKSSQYVVNNVIYKNKKDVKSVTGLNNELV